MASDMRHIDAMRALHNAIINNDTMPDVGSILSESLPSQAHSDLLHAAAMREAQMAQSGSPSNFDDSLLGTATHAVAALPDTVAAKVASLLHSDDPHHVAAGVKFLDDAAQETSLLPPEMRDAAAFKMSPEEALGQLKGYGRAVAVVPEQIAGLPADMVEMGKDLASYGIKNTPRALEVMRDALVPGHVQKHRGENPAATYEPALVKSLDAAEIPFTSDKLIELARQYNLAPQETDDRNVLMPEAAMSTLLNLTAVPHGLNSTVRGINKLLPAAARPVVGPHYPVVNYAIGGPVGFSKIGSVSKAIEALKKADEAVSGATKATKAGKNLKSTQLPSLRELPVEEGIKVAARQPHLIPSGEASEGLYVGGPREMQTRQDLTNARRYFDRYVAADPRGGDWYDRYRAGLAQMTGNNPQYNDWASKMEGQWSAGVDPSSEFGFAIKENNAGLMGMPVKAARPAQHEAFMRALEANDPSLLQLGKKTGEYARKVNPDQLLPPTATGVNDFRHAQNWGYTEPSGKPQRAGLSSAQMNFLDYETALAVKRANEKNVGGRSDWTGEALQAAPWVRQKALAFMSRNPNLSYEDAFARANTTIADAFPKHTFYGTYEAQPGRDIGHLQGSVTAPEEERLAYAADPRSTWKDPLTGRDLLYSGLRYGDTGVAARVLPSLEMKGMYQPPEGALETNPGEAARPLVGLRSMGRGEKELEPASRTMVNLGEATRAYIDAQLMGAGHIPIVGGPAGKSRSFFMPKEGPATKQELLDLKSLGAKYGLNDVVDTGQGITLTSFDPEPLKLKTKEKQQLISDIGALGHPEARQVKIDSIYQNYSDAFQNAPGSGQGTKQLLDLFNSATPEARAAFNNNPHIPQMALQRLARDEDWAQKWGVTGQHFQNARKIIGEGKGWIDRLEEGLKSGTILPAVGAAILAPLAAGLSSQKDEDSQQ